MTGWAAPGDPAEIVNWRRLDERITTSGQPREEQLAALAALGVRHVVNLALHSHPQALADEGGSVRALDMTYTHIPVDFAGPTDADFAAFEQAMAAASDGPVHVHCIVNARVTAFVHRWGATGGAADPARSAAMLESVWRPGDVWAAFLGDETGVGRASAYAGRDY